MVCTDLIVRARPRRRVIWRRLRRDDVVTGITNLDASGIVRLASGLRSVLDGVSPMRIIHTSLVVLFISTSRMQADPVLLAAFDGHLVRPASAPAEPRVELHLLAESEGLSAALGPGITWGQSDSGSVEFNTGNSAQFAVFANIAANGVDDIVRDGVFWPADIGGGGVFAENRESLLYDRTIDLVGFRLESVRLTVHGVEFGPYVFPNGADGLFVDYDVTYEFYGTPIPEPLSAALLLVGAAILKGVKQ